MYVPQVPGNEALPIVRKILLKIVCFDLLSIPMKVIKIPD
jgi:hypothetical protein